MIIRGILTFVAAAIAWPILAAPALQPIRLHAGANAVPNIAGDGRQGRITLEWRENGNAWSYDIFTVSVGGSIATIEGKDQISDSPHTGEDMIRSVRFARGMRNGQPTTFLLIADRLVTGPIPDPAKTDIRIYALARNRDGIGTPYEFQPVQRLRTVRFYCHADMALKTELGFPLAGSYAGAKTVSGCPN